MAKKTCKMEMFPANFQLAVKVAQRSQFLRRNVELLISVRGGFIRIVPELSKKRIMKQVKGDAGANFYCDINGNVVHWLTS